MRVSTCLWASVQSLALLAITLFASATAIGQDSSAGFAPGGSMVGSDNPLGGGGGFGGGAAMADFDTLINLIQQTIEPDSWLQNGGTNTILPYPAGVYVDPQGHMKRVRASAELKDDLFRKSSDLRHPWRQASKLRTISLKRLDEAIQRAHQQGLVPSSEITKLAGLSRISYVQIDPANEDVLIAGPAGDSMFGFELQDLAVVAALINSETAPLGCSIEPSDAGLLAAQDMIQSQNIAGTLARNPRLVVEKLQEKIGPHKVRVFGMSGNTGTAIALIDADEHMKKLGFGNAKTRVGVSSYFDHLDALGGKVPSQSLIRWWFAFADEPIKANVTGDTFQLPEQCVAVLSEQQWVSQQGRAPTGANDPAADAFAKGLTEQLSALRETHASYARLSAVFEISLALQLACESTGQPSLKAWLPNLCALGQSNEVGNVEPQTVDGLTTWHKTKTGTVVAVVSGGVKVDTLSLATQERWQSSKFLASSVVPTAPEQAPVVQGSWWWD